MTESPLLLVPVLVPVAGGLVAYAMPRGNWRGRGAVGIAALAIALAASVWIVGLELPQRCSWQVHALEWSFDLEFTPLVTPLGLLLPLETVLVLFLAGRFPRDWRTTEAWFYLLFTVGIVNGLVLAQNFAEIVLFGELVFVTVYGLTALVALAGDPSRGAASAWAMGRLHGAAFSSLYWAVRELAGMVAAVADRGLDWVYERAIPGLGKLATGTLRRLHDGRYATYLGWVLLGLLAIGYFLLAGCAR